MSKGKRIRENKALQEAEANNTIPPWILPDGRLNQKQLDVLKGLKIVVGAPMYGGLCYGAFAVALGNLQMFADRVGMSLMIQTLFNESLVQRGRNAITHLALKTDPDYVLFIDSDIGFNALQVIEMLLCAQMLKEPLLGATYSKKEINWPQIRTHIANGVHDQWMAHCAGSHVIIPAAEGKQEIKYFEPLEVKYLGTGFMLISRAAFAAIKPACGVYANNHVPIAPFGEDVVAYFDCEIRYEPAAQKKIYLSEDYLFCARAIDAGLKPKLLPWLNLIHFGTIAYDGCYVCSNGGYIHPVKEPKKA